MATFLEIQNKVKTRIIDLPSAVVSEIPDLVNEAIRDAEDLHNFQAMKAKHAVTTTDVTRKLGDAPSDWKEARARPYLREGQDGTQGTRVIEFAVSLEDMIERFALDDTTDAGGPRFVLEEYNDSTDTLELWVFPFPDTNSLWTNGLYRIVVPYWQYLADLSADGDTNWFTLNADKYIIAQASAEAFLLNQDEQQAGVYGRLASARLARIIRVDKLRVMHRDMNLVPKFDVFGSLGDR